MINPYKNLNWGSVVKTALTTHSHCKTQYALDRLLGEGVNGIAISNYYKSEPCYTLAQKAAEISEPNDPIVDISGADGKIQIPNAEQHSCTDIKNLHFNSVGSTFSSGNPHGVSPVGVNNTVLYGINQTKAYLLYPTGGGVTINHPIWSKLTLKNVEKILDYSEIVLGIEIYNQTCELMHQETPATYESGWALDMWDNILKTGRRCWGFAVPDHDCEENSRSDRVGDPWLGRIVTLTTSATQENVLKAIRNGAFYAQIGGSSGFTNLSFSNISVSGKTVSATVSESASIKAVSNGEVIAEQTGTSISVELPYNYGYVRFEARTENDAIFSNPIMFKNKNPFDSTDVILMI